MFLAKSLCLFLFCNGCLSQVPTIILLEPLNSALYILGAADAPNYTKSTDILEVWFDSGSTFQHVLRGSHKGAYDRTPFHTEGPEADLYLEGHDQHRGWFHSSLLLGCALYDRAPYRGLLTHGFATDGQGRKMSKSLGNIIDPLTMIEKYGADAARLSLIIGAAPGNDIKLSEDRVRGYKHFANKLWNISRFVLENIEEGSGSVKISAEDQKLVDEAHVLASHVSTHIDAFRLDLAADAVYHFVWDRFAAEMLEESKSILKGEDAAARQSRAHTLYEILIISLKLLHPFMPFVTEAIWQKLPILSSVNKPTKENDLLMVASWPAQK